MDVNALLLFVEIVEAGNLSAAARRLSMTRSNISHRLKNFEESVGARLLRRTTRTLTLTNAGELLFLRGKRILGEVAAARAGMTALENGVAGSVRLNAPRGYGHVSLSEPLVQFSLQHRRIELEVLFDNDRKDLFAHNIDVAVHIWRAPPASARVIQSYEVEWMICASPKYLQANGAPSSIEQLRDRGTVCFGPVGIEALPTALHGECITVVLRPLVLTDDVVFAREATLGGVGIGVLPDYMVAEAMSSGKLRRLFPGYTINYYDSKLFLLAMEERFTSRAAALLIEFLSRSLDAKHVDTSLKLADESRHEVRLVLDTAKADDEVQIHRRADRVRAGTARAA
jgi:DNA-binding transcriptional LysR family regulator